MFTSYNSKNSVLVVAGTFITGKAEEFWTFTKREALAEDAEGADGDVVRNVKNSNIWDAEVTVQATSPQANFLFSLMHRSEPFSIWCEDKALDRREGGSQALMNEAPEDTRGTTAGDLTFKFSVYDGEIGKSTSFEE